MIITQRIEVGTEDVKNGGLCVAACQCVQSTSLCAHCA